MADQLASLNASRTNWTIKVRVTRTWLSQTHEGVILRHHLTILDDQNCHMQAFVRPAFWNHLQHPILEGNIYVFSNFVVRQTTGNLRPVYSMMCIHFSHITTVQHVPEDDLAIPMHKFEFRSLASLYEYASWFPKNQIPLFSTDVIGIMENLQEVRTVQTVFGEKQVVTFNLTDGRISYKVNIFGPLNAATEALYQNYPETPIIVILASIEVKVYRRTLKISNLPSTKIFINLDHDDVIQMRQRFIDQGNAAQVPDP